MIFLRSLFFNIFLFGGIAVACIIAFPLLFLKDKHMICAGKILSKYIGFLLKIFIDVNINFKGLENLKKFDKYFVASAHQSMFETFALQTVISGPVFILKKGLMKIPFFGWCLKKIGAIFVEEIDEIGDKTARSIVDFFSDINNIQIINRLKSFGLNFYQKDYDVHSAKLNGKIFVISGVFESYSRDEIKNIIELNGGKVSSSVSKKTNYLVAGNNIGPSKLSTANELGVSIINEVNLIDLIS